MTPSSITRKQAILAHVVAGKSQRRAAMSAGVSQQYVSKVWRESLGSEAPKREALPEIRRATDRVAKGQSLRFASEQEGCSYQSLKSHIFRNYDGTASLRMLYRLGYHKIGGGDQ